jgi:hypothetical protein
LALRRHLMAYRPEPTGVSSAPINGMVRLRAPYLRWCHPMAPPKTTEIMSKTVFVTDRLPGSAPPPLRCSRDVSAWWCAPAARQGLRTSGPPWTPVVVGELSSQAEIKAVAEQVRSVALSRSVGVCRWDCPEFSLIDRYADRRFVRLW